MFWLVVLGWTAYPVVLTSGAGRFLEPPSRASAWRYGFPTPVNFEDDALSCGGKENQWEVHGGKCGVCGDPWQGPRYHEAGGRFATGLVVRTYDAGDTIRTRVELTDNKLGWFEFRLCPHDDPTVRVQQSCLDTHLLRNPSNKTRFLVPAGSRFVEMLLRLPAGVTCLQCVLQWKYNTGRAVGIDPEIGLGCLGCGQQEQYYGCADVAIRGPPKTPAPQWTTATTTTPSTVTTSTKHSYSVWYYASMSPTTKSTTTTSPHTVPTWYTPDTPAPTPTCRGVGIWANIQGIIEWCSNNCARGFCPPDMCVCTNDQPVPSTLPPCICHAINGWKGLASMARWCQIVCAQGFCPDHVCKCAQLSYEYPSYPSVVTKATAPPWISSSTIKTTTKPWTVPRGATTKKPLQECGFICRAHGVKAKTPGMDKWCRVNCCRGQCPPSICVCHKH